MNTILLGELIELLELREASQYVRYDFGNLVPTDIMSYRGYYYDLALNFDERSYSERPTVKDVLTLLRSANNKKFSGYKGGEYLMTLNTRVWVDNYGGSSDTGIVGLADCDYDTVIATAYCEMQ